MKKLASYELRSRLVELRGATNAAIRRLDDQHRVRSRAEEPAEEGSVIEGQVGFDLFMAALQALERHLKETADWMTQNRVAIEEALLPVEMRGDVAPGTTPSGG